MNRHSKTVNPISWVWRLPLTLVLLAVMAALAAGESILNTLNRRRAGRRR